MEKKNSKHLQTFQFNFIWTFYPFSLPWNQQSLTGYFFMTCLDISTVESDFFFNGSILLLFIFICFHHQAFYKRFEYLVQKLEVPDKKRNDKNFLHELIQFHILVKEWVKRFSSFWTIKSTFSSIVYLLHFFSIRIILPQLVLWIGGNL